MELVFSRKDMDRAMKMVSRVAGKPAILPVLSHVLISAGRDRSSRMRGWDMSEGLNGDRIYVAATDLEMSIRTGIPGQIMEGGAIAIPARTFASVINALVEEEVKLIASGDKARICCDKGEFKMVGMSVHEFPSLIAGTDGDMQLELAAGTEEKQETHLFSLSADALGWMIRKTAFAASKDNARYFLNGVHLSLKPGGGVILARMAATDGARLAVASVTVEEEVLEREVEAIITSKAVRELERLSTSSDVVGIGLQESRMVFDAGDTVLASTLIEGQYPDYQKAIPDGSRINLKADTGHLLAVIRRISQVSDPRMPCVKLEMTDARLKVSANSVHVGDGCEEMDLGSPSARKKKETDVGSPSARKEKDGDNIVIAVNARYLMDALQAIDTQETLMGIDSEVKPMVIRPSLGNHLCVLMPVRLAAG